MSTDIMKAFRDGSYRALGELEQSLVSMVSESGKPMKVAELYEEVLKIIKEISSETDRVRIILIALLTLDLKPK